MKYKWLRSALLTMVAGSTLAACSSEEAAQDSTGDAEVSIVTSFYPMYEFTSQVAGDRADITLMVEGGDDAHHYEPSAQEVAAVNEADLFVYSSPEMEFWVESLLETVENDDLKMVAATDAVSQADYSQEAEQDHAEDETTHDHEGEAHDHEEAEPVGEMMLSGLAEHYHAGDAVTIVAETEAEVSEWQWSTRKSEETEWSVFSDQTTEQFNITAESENLEIQGVGLDADGNEIVNTGTVEILVDNHENEDPHSWLDPVLVQEQVNAIRDALIEIDPEGEEVYTGNAADFNERLQALDQEFQEAFEGAENRVFVVQHQAFGYIAERYDLEQIAVGGLSTEVEPSPSRIAEIGTLVEEYDAPVIYYQQGSNSSIAQTIASETGTETAVLHDLESLSEELQAENLGYIEAMEQNIESLKLSIK